MKKKTWTMLLLVAGIMLSVAGCGRKAQEYEGSNVDLMNDKVTLYCGPCVLLE